MNFDKDIYKFFNTFKFLLMWQNLETAKMIKYASFKDKCYSYSIEFFLFEEIKGNFGVIIIVVSITNIGGDIMGKEAISLLKMVAFNI